MEFKKTADIIKKILEDNKYDEVTYAEKIGKTRQSVSYYIKDQRAPSKDFLEKLYSDFNVPLEIQEEIELYEDWRKTPDRIKIMYMDKEEKAEKYKKFFIRLTKMVGLYKCFLQTASDIFGDSIIDEEVIEELEEMGIEL